MVFAIDIDIFKRSGFAQNGTSWIFERQGYHMIIRLFLYSLCV
jgi:hypothetical protein